MITRTANAQWEGDLKGGKGVFKVAAARLEAPFTYASRFEQGKGGNPVTNPEELIGAAHAGCFSMALSNMLAKDGHAPKRVETTATVHLDTEQGKIVKIELATHGEVPGIDAKTFQHFAEKAKTGCPISKTLEGVEITLQAKFTPSAAPKPTTTAKATAPAGRQ